MDVVFLIKGIIIGFSIAAPVGPIGVLCIRRSLTNGHLSGFISGLGAASADAVYGIIAAFGLTFISSFIISQQSFLQLIGMMFLFYLGIKIFFEKPRVLVKEKVNRRDLINNYFSTFLLTITNPITILSFLAVFAGLGLVQTEGNYFSASMLVCGVFLGSSLWWLILSNSVSLFRKKIKTKILLWINRVSGLIIVGFAIILLISLIKNVL